MLIRGEQAHGHRALDADGQLYTIAAIIASRSTNVATLISMRCVQAVGSAAVVSVGAGSLADIFEVHERGQKVVTHLPLDHSVLTASLVCSTECLYWDRPSVP